MSKHLFNIIMLNVINWAFNISLAMFTWSVNHVYAVAIVGLYFLRMAAEIIYKKAMQEEVIAARAEFLEAARTQLLAEQSQNKQFSEEEPFETILNEFEEEKLVETDKKVH